jgi:hypothetical protein
MNWNKLHLFGRTWVEHSFKTLVDRNVRERRREERGLAERRLTRHQLPAIKSCIADSRSYRVARKLPALLTAQFE